MEEVCRLVHQAQGSIGLPYAVDDPNSLVALRVVETGSRRIVDKGAMEDYVGLYSAVEGQEPRDFRTDSLGAQLCQSSRAIARPVLVHGCVVLPIG
jgi:hypothetical protein